LRVLGWLKREDGVFERTLLVGDVAGVGAVSSVGMAIGERNLIFLEKVDYLIRTLQEAMHVKEWWGGNFR
jgi:hypothetical protein